MTNKVSVEPVAIEVDLQNIVCRLGLTCSLLFNTPRIK